MKKTRIGINGFGRIGRTLTRIMEPVESIELVAINDLADAPTLAHLLKYDSIHGSFKGDVSSTASSIVINDREVHVHNQKSPEDIPWEQNQVDIVIECTGLFKTREQTGGHLTRGVQKVIVSAPAASDIKSVVLGVNDSILEPDDLIVSNASCTTNSLAPMIKVLADNWGIEQGYITTVHSYTSDQRLHDAPHRDLRRARAASQSIVPTTTGAAKAITRIFPELDGSLGGAGIRVPVPNGSLTDFSCILKKDTTVAEINAAFKEAAQSELKGILEYTEDPIVSIDIIDNPHSCVFDAQLTSVIGKMVKVVGWYDNEWGYSNRLVDLIGKMR